MPEILTESFCERCGTRYTFESSAPKRRPLGGVRTLSKGLKNFVLSDDSSFSEAMAAARSDEEHQASANQLDAFHKTFNFCMTCRQYTCGNCWNEAEGRCLTCAPHLGHEVMPAPFPDLDPLAGIELATGASANGNGHRLEEAWPDVDLSSERLGRAMGLSSLDLDRADDVVATEPAEAVDAVVEAVAAPDVAEAPGAAGVDEPIDELVSEPVGDVALDVAAAEPVAEAVEPVVDVAEPAEAVAEPVDAVAEPVEAVAEPVEAAAEPVELEPAADVPEAQADATADEPIDAEPVDLSARLAGDIAAPAAPAAPRTLDDRAAAAAAQTGALLAKFRPGQSLDDALAAYEAELAKARSAAATPSEPAPAAVEAEALQPADTPETAAPPAVEPPAAPARGRDVVAQPVWPVAQPTPPATPVQPAPAPAAPPPVPQAQPPAPAAPIAAQAVPTPTQPWSLTPPGDVAAQPEWPATPEWPSTPQWPAATPAIRSTRAPAVPTLAGRPLVPDRSVEALWAASSNEVLAREGTATAGVQPCVSCGLSLSANARFCRRCGSPQG